MIIITLSEETSVQTRAKIREYLRIQWNGLGSIGIQYRNDMTPNQTALDGNVSFRDAMMIERDIHAIMHDKEILR